MVRSVQDSIRHVTCNYIDTGKQALRYISFVLAELACKLNVILVYTKSQAENMFASLNACSFPVSRRW